MKRSLHPGPLLCVPLIALFGCHAETFGGDDPVIDPAALEVTAGIPIAGNAVTVSAQWMATLPAQISIQFDSGPPTTAERNEGSPDGFVVQLPSALPAGSHEIYLVRSASSRDLIGRVRTGGFSELRSVRGSIFGPSQLLPSLPGVIGLGPANGCGAQAVQLDARRAMLTTVPNSSTCTYGVGASYVPGRFLVYRPWSNGYWLRIGQQLGRTAVDSLGVWGSYWPTHEIAPGLYLQDQKQLTFLVDTATGPELLDNGGYGHPEHITFSDDGAWAVSSHTRSTKGLLIIDRRDRTHHWGAGWAMSTHALFLPNGALVAYGWRASGTAGSYQEILAHIDVATGAIIDSVRFADAGSPYDLPVALTLRPWIVLAGGVGDHVELSIRDVVTLQEIAHPRSASFSSSCFYSSGFWVVEDPSLGRFYVVGNECYEQIPVLTFQLPE